MKPTRLIPLALVAAALVAAGCGGSDGDKASQSDTSAKTTASAPSTTSKASTVADASENAPAVSNATDLAHKPKIAKPTGDTPQFLVTKDLVTGKGPAVTTGDTVEVQYVGVSWSTGEEFDASWDRGGDPFSFTVGNSEVIQGWDQGLLGMRAGGRRELVIPPDLGYGDDGSPPAILGGETLVFVVDLKKID